MYIEKLEEVTSIFSKYQITLLPLILSGDRLQFVMPGPWGRKNETVDKSSYSLRTEGSQWELTRVRGQPIARMSLPSIAIKRLSRFKLFEIQKNENDVNCGNTNETTTAMSLHFISSRYSSLERTRVSTKQAKWKQGDFNYCLVHMKIRSNWGKPSTQLTPKLITD